MNLKNSPFRLLDIKDLVIITMFKEDIPFTAIARTMGLAPASISHRLRKYESLWEGFTVRNSRTPNSHKEFSAVFNRVHGIASGMLDALEGMGENTPNS